MKWTFGPSHSESKNNIRYYTILNNFLNPLWYTNMRSSHIYINNPFINSQNVPITHHYNFSPSQIFISQQPWILKKQFLGYTNTRIVEEKDNAGLSKEISWPRCTWQGLSKLTTDFIGLPCIWHFNQVVLFETGLITLHRQKYFAWIESQQAAAEPKSVRQHNINNL